ncbi:MAG: thioredoxin [Clostridia bacterium]|nr:thioredoxin [Clostridia bacterium]MBR5767075.1 thioredoxin [Clostridia bacterium]
MSGIIEVTSATFQKEVLESDKPVLVDFNASWCGPCRMLKPVIAEIAAENPSVKVASVNIDEEDLLAEDYDVSSIPCLVLFKGGREVSRKIGFRPKDDILGMLV